MNRLTALQRATLFAHVKNAAAECGEKPEAYRKRIMREELAHAAQEGGRGAQPSGPP